jgi:hypothetical protein
VTFNEARLKLRYEHDRETFHLQHGKGAAESDSVSAPEGVVSVGVERCLLLG